MSTRGVRSAETPDPKRGEDGRCVFWFRREKLMSFKFQFIFPAHYHAGFSNATRPKLISQTPVLLPPIKFLFSRIQFLRMTFSLSLRFKHFSFTPCIQVVSDCLQGRRFTSRISPESHFSFSTTLPTPYSLLSPGFW